MRNSEAMKAYWSNPDWAAMVRERQREAGVSRRAKNEDRNARICELYKAGNTLEEIGREIGMTRERIRQIVSAAGLTKHDGGFQVRRKMLVA